MALRNAWAIAQKLDAGLVMLWDAHTTQKNKTLRADAAAMKRDEGSDENEEDTGGSVGDSAEELERLQQEEDLHGEAAALHAQTGATSSSAQPPPARSGCFLRFVPPTLTWCGNVSAVYFFRELTREVFDRRHSKLRTRMTLPDDSRGGGDSAVGFRSEAMHRIDRKLWCPFDTFRALQGLGWVQPEGFLHSDHPYVHEPWMDPRAQGEGTGTVLTRWDDAPDKSEFENRRKALQRPWKCKDFVWISECGDCYDAPPGWKFVPQTTSAKALADEKAAEKRARDPDALFEVGRCVQRQMLLFLLTIY